MPKKPTIPGIIRPTEGFHSTDGKNQPKSIEDGEYDRAIEEVSSMMLSNLRKAQSKSRKRSRDAA